MSRLYEIFLECNSQVSTDSRKVAGGALFFALRGENFDGNDFALSALENGAKWVVADREELRGSNEHIIVVENSLTALQDLAREHRQAIDITIIALTGTNGKTTTKELLKCALETHYKNVGATLGNLNNDIGVPLTLLSFSPETEIAIVEMGANHPGEIATLCNIALPDAGLITNIGRAHLEGFGSVEGIVKTKGELYDYLNKHTGLAFYNSDDPTLSSMVLAREGLFTFPYSGAKGIGRELSLFGGYNQLNAAAALAISTFFACDKTQVKKALSRYTSTNNRSEVIAKTPQGNRLVVDCYNANPSSMHVAITEFLATDSTLPKVLILGSMKELGDYSLSEHLKVVELCQAADRIILIGTEFSGISADESHKELTHRIEFYSSAQEVHQLLESNRIEASTILLKGSRSNRLEQLIELL